MTHLLLHKTPNSVSSEPGAAQILFSIRELKLGLSLIRLTAGFSLVRRSFGPLPMLRITERLANALTLIFLLSFLPLVIFRFVNTAKTTRVVGALQASFLRLAGQL
jgi:hypothetical protein